MSKQGMKHFKHEKDKKETAIVPEIQGKAKHGKEKANPIIAGTVPPSQKVYHSVPVSMDRPISNVYKVIDNDIARDNLENDLTSADLQDL